MIYIDQEKYKTLSIIRNITGIAKNTNKAFRCPNQHKNFPKNGRKSFGKPLGSNISKEIAITSPIIGKP